jgi:ribonuclease M5
MVKIKEAIVVEGRYDKNTLSQILDAPILETSGFGIFKDKQQMALLRRIAETRGLIVFTDSDGAGFVIRNHIKSAIPGKYLKHAYIPDVYGKERRKAAPGKEGKLGVEGMTREVILESLRRAGATIEGEAVSESQQITKQCLMELGLSGGPDASANRLKLLKKLKTPREPKKLRKKLKLWLLKKLQLKNLQTNKELQIQLQPKFRQKNSKQKIRLRNSKMLMWLLK